ncbi:hypothetical protein KP509_09G014400 [Ceratopteris richardii]|uniref:non-specific serine/threonine protein kinase n=3 Tax=Ceratopteris richardii TaxID=49495 RepID=A0A8T2U0F2_CERRI|nr:hypothetical protein KP509_09G014400 [Ceratopteris richardii]
MPMHQAEGENLRTRVGKYELGRILGEGSFAKVRFARNVETGQGVAVKIFNKSDVLQRNLFHQIEMEIFIMKLIKHPNIVQLYEVMASKSKIYFVLEYVAGGELYKKIKQRRRLKEDKARNYFQQLIQAIDFCHSRGIYHRDLKPENLLLDRNGTLKISDFGLSALVHQQRGDRILHSACGTPNYVAPEVAFHKGYNGAKADIWSCGIILFVMMAGYLPFDDSNLIHLYRKMQRAKLNFPPWFSPEVCSLISRILKPSPMHRITIPEILKDPWFMKDISIPKFQDETEVSLNDVYAILNESKELLVAEENKLNVPGPAQWNAFDLISLTNELSFSKFLGTEQVNRQETHFASRSPPSEIIRRMEETAKPLGFYFLRNNYKLKLQGSEAGRKGHVSVSAEVFEVAPDFYFVELKKCCGDSLEYQEFYDKFSKALKDIVWQNEVG